MPDGANAVGRSCAGKGTATAASRNAALRCANAIALEQRPATESEGKAVFVVSLDDILKISHLSGQVNTLFLKTLGNAKTRKTHTLTTKQEGVAGARPVVEQFKRQRISEAEDDDSVSSLISAPISHRSRNLEQLLLRPGIGASCFLFADRFEKNR